MGNGIVRGGLNVVVMPVGERENGDGERVQCEQATNGGLTSVTTLSCSSGDSGGGVAGVAGADQSASSTSTGLEVSCSNSDTCVRHLPIQTAKSAPAKPAKLSGDKVRQDTKDNILEKLEDMKRDLDAGSIPSVETMKKTLSLAMEIMKDKKTKCNSMEHNEECLGSVGDAEVRQWLSSTFTLPDSIVEMSRDPLLRFKAAANSVIISNFWKRSCTTSAVEEVVLPDELGCYLKANLNTWDFDIFHVKTLSKNSPLRYVALQLFKYHNLFKKFSIPVSTFNWYMSKIEEGYNHFNNPYHNSCHGADVGQTIHYLIVNSGLKNLMSDLEVMAVLLAAIVHDVDHPGRSNQFLVQQNSKLAQMYHDKSVLENHHLKVTFDLIFEEPTNFLVNLTVEDYRSLRGIVIDMVLATDMAQHFNMVKSLATIVSSPEGGIQLLEKQRHKMFESLLHLVDIAHPGKPWQLHHQWSVRVSEEFYRQGDEETELQVPVSPLCDRNNNNFPTSQIKFAEIIVAPLFKVGGDMIELALKTGKEKGLIEDVVAYPQVWDTCLQENIKMWEERQKKAEEFRRPIVPSKKESPVSRKISMQQYHRHRRATDIRRKASVGTLMYSPQQTVQIDRYFQSSQVIRVPKILLQPIDPSDLKHSNSSTPGRSASSGFSDRSGPALGNKAKNPSNIPFSTTLESTSEETGVGKELEENKIFKNQTDSKSSAFKLPELPKASTDTTPDKDGSNNLQTSHRPCSSVRHNRPSSASPWSAKSHSIAAPRESIKLTSPRATYRRSSTPCSDRKETTKRHRVGVSQEPIF